LGWAEKRIKAFGRWLYLCDNSGIYSLAGFAYQIKVFVLQVLELKSGYTLEYETIDDVALKMTADKLEEHEDELCSILTATSRTAIQVKRTQVTNSIAKKVVKNWLLTDKNNDDIEQFVLVTDREVDRNIFANLDDDEIVKEVNTATGNKSIDAKVKLIGYTETELKQKVRDVKLKADVRICDNIDTRIEDKFKDFFIRFGVNEATYYGRIKELLQQLTVEILDAVGKGQPYQLSYEKMCQIKNSIITNYTDEKWEPSFSQFRKLKKVSLDDLAVIKSREYQQLRMCELLQDDDISRHLQWGEYYANSKRGYYERGMAGIVDDIETTAYENFCDVKMELRNSSEDTPDNRLIKTKSKSNSKAVDKQIRYGVCINLTSEDTDESIQISWKDD
jgi:hypothetical protein